jgi:transposase
MMFVRAYPRETQEIVFDAHERAFAFFKGACSRGIYDTMKTAVDAVFDPAGRPTAPLASYQTNRQIIGIEPTSTGDPRRRAH